MGRTSDPVLKWLRGLIEGRGSNTAALADKCGIPRQRLRRILSGSDPMLVDELVQISNALEISPGDMGLPEAPAPAPDASAEPEGTEGDEPEGTEDDEPAGIDTSGLDTSGLDPWGNHTEQLFRVAFALGCDFFFLTDPAQLEGSGVPAAVLEKYRGGYLNIGMDARYHPHNDPRYDAEGVTLTLSFDALYDCRFPWSSIKQVTFVPQPEPVAQVQPKKPHLRLVD